MATKILSQDIDTSSTFSIATNQFGDGTVSTPSMSFLSDPSTGLYHSGTNQVSLANNGVENFRFGVNGTLRLVGANTNTNSTNGALLLSGTGATNNHIIRFSGNSGAFDSLIYMPGSSNDLRFGKTDGTTTTDLMWFQQAGHLGIGASPNIGGTSGHALTLSSGVSGVSVSIFEIQGTRTTNNSIFAEFDMYHQTNRVATIFGNRGTADDEGFITFSTKTTALGLTEAMRIDPAQRVGIGTSPVTKLQVGTSGATSTPANTGTTPSTGTVVRIQANSNAVLDIGSNSSTYAWIQSTDQTGLNTTYPLALNPNGGQVLMPYGTVSLPGISFAGDTGTGIFRVGANEIGISTGGAQVLDITTGWLGILDGTTSRPGLLFQNDPDTGFFRQSNGRASFSSNGFETIRFGGASNGSGDGVDNFLLEGIYGGNSCYAQMYGRTTTSITNTGAYIATQITDSFFIISGNDGTNYFRDILGASYNIGSVTPIQSTTVGGSPASRTYNADGTGLKLTMGSGTYKVNAFWIDLGRR